MNRRKSSHNDLAAPSLLRQAMAILGSYSVSLPLVAAFAALLLMVMQTGNSHQRVENVTEILAQQQAERLMSALNSLSDRVGNLATSNALLGGKDSEVTRQTLAQLVPEAIGMSLVPLGPLGIADKDNAAVNSLQTHIERDMLRRASEEKSAIVDVFQHDGRWLVGVAHPIPGYGVLLARFSSDHFKKILSTNLNGRAQVQLLIRHKNRSRPIINIAIANPGNISAVERLPIENWQVRVTPDQGLLDEFAEHNIPLMLVIAVCILIAILNVLVSARATAALNRARKEAAVKARERRQTARPKASLEQAFAEAQQAPAAGPELTQAPDNPFDMLDDEEATESPQLNLASIAREHLEQQSAQIFRAYDIRGLAEEQLDNATCTDIGRAIGSEIQERGHAEVLVARDGRVSSPRIHEALVNGLRGAGVDVVDLGIIPTPLLHFATFELDIACGVMITGSHNAPTHNGMKIVMDRQALSDDAIQGLRERVESGRFSEGDGGYREAEIKDAYIQRIAQDIALAHSIKIVIDAGNGVTGAIAPDLFTEIGCRVEPLYCDIDGRFPNHPPDPTIEENLAGLKKAVQTSRAHLGLAFDGDGDRLVVVTAKGRALNADQLMMILARDVVARNPGCPIVYDVKCSRMLPRMVSELGGVPIMWRSGHSFMKRKIAETGALFGGEFSGHLFYKERWFGFDDGMYAAARLLEILSLQNASLDGLLSELPTTHSTPEILVPVADDRKFQVVEQFAGHDELGGTVSRLDGVRVDYADGWGLVRASNTNPALTLRFEADSQQSLERIVQTFTQVLSSIDSELAISF